MSVCVSESPFLFLVVSHLCLSLIISSMSLCLYVKHICVFMSVSVHLFACLCLRVFTLWVSESLCGFFCELFVCLCESFSYESLFLTLNWDPAWTRSVPKIKDGKTRDFPADLSDWYSLKWLGQPIGILPLLHHFLYPSVQWNHRACGGGGGIWSVSLSALPWTHSIRHTSSGLVSNSHKKTENSQHWR